MNRQYCHIQIFFMIHLNNPDHQHIYLYKIHHQHLCQQLNINCYLLSHKTHLWNLYQHVCIPGNKLTSNFGLNLFIIINLNFTTNITVHPATNSSIENPSKPSIKISINTSTTSKYPAITYTNLITNSPSKI